MTDAPTPPQRSAGTAPAERAGDVRVPDTRRWWAAGGVLAGVAGLAVSQFAAELLSVRETPFLAIASAISKLTPGSLAQATAEFLLTLARPLLLVGVMVVLMGFFVLGGLLWRRSPWAALPVWVLLGGLNLAAAFVTNGTGTQQVLPVVAGFGVWMVLLGWTDLRLRRYERALVQAAVDADGADDDTDRGHEPGRRGVLVAFGFGALTIAAASAGSWLVERRRDAVRESRRLLRIPGVTRPRVPEPALAGVEGIAPWQTPNDDFYVVSRALRTPTMEASEWKLRIHGLVDRPLELTYSELLARGLSEAWVTMVAAGYEVGGSQVGNAWWSGVPTRVLLEEAGVDPEADAVLQTSVDGWTCVTPLGPLTDERSSLLAVAMNGVALPLEHGFPVRSIVPGLYSDTSSCKWVVDWEVTRFRDVDSTSVGDSWDVRAPIRLASRVDVPADGQRVPFGEVAFGGYAWDPSAGLDGVEFAVDGGRWREGRVAAPGTDEAWAQWGGSVRLDAGEHTVRVRAVDKYGEKQTGAKSEPAPSGATGWHEVKFTVDEPE